MTNEYITKQQVIELVKRCEVIIGCTGAAVLTREIERMADGWISVEDKLPGNCEPVLIWAFGCCREVGCYNERNKLWETISNAYENCVTHWMPLPKPPKE